VETARDNPSAKVERVSALVMRGLKAAALELLIWTSSYSSQVVYAERDFGASKHLSLLLKRYCGIKNRKPYLALG
jgi:hypothetical protein